MAKKAREIGGDISNGGEAAIEAQIPYLVELRLQGTADLLWHRYDCEAVEAVSRAPKGSKIKKEDNIESYVSRDSEGYLCLPGEYVRQSLLTASKFRQDPRSSRKSALDLYKAGLVTMTPLARIIVDGKPTKEWCYVDRRRVRVGLSAVPRSRPATKAGWEAVARFQVLLPEYIHPQDVHALAVQAGQLVGLADFRPTYGRYAIVHFEEVKLS